MERYSPAFEGTRFVVHPRFAVTLIVPTAVKLNYQSRLKTTEVDDIWTDRMLTTKPGPMELAVAQAHPEFVFGGSA